METKQRFIVYHAHYTMIIGSADTLEQAFAIGEQQGCRDRDCPCHKYYVYDRHIHTYDVSKMIKQRIKEEDYAIYRKTGKWRK